jgi:hypothetical protein
MPGSALVNRVDYVIAANKDAAAPLAGASWIRLPTIGRQLLNKEQLDDGVEEDNEIGASTPPQPTVKKASYSTAVRLWGGDKKFGATTDPTSCFAQGLLENYFGMSADLGFGGTTVSGSNTGQGTVAAPLAVTLASTITPGMGIRYGQKVRFVLSKATNNLVLNAALGLPVAPTSGDVLGAFYFRPTLGERAQVVGLQVKRDTHKDMAFYGGVFGLKLQNMAAEGGAQLAMDMEFDKWLAPVDIASPQENQFTHHALMVKGGDLIIGQDAAAANLCFSEASIDFGVSREWIECNEGAGDNGRDGIHITGQRPTATAKVYYLADLWTKYEAKTAVPVMFSMVQPGGGAGWVGVFFPNATIGVKEGTIGNKESLDLTFTAHEPTAAQKANGITASVYFSVGSGI